MVRKGAPNKKKSIFETVKVSEIGSKTQKKNTWIQYIFR